MGGDAGPDERRGVTSVVGIILMIGVLFLIAMGAAAGAFLIASTLPDAPKQAGFSFDFTDDGTSDELVIRHVSGDALDGSNVTIQLSDAFSEENEGRYVWTDDLGGPSPAEPGTAVTLSVATVDDEDTLNLNGATVKVIWTGAGENGSSNILMTWTGPGTVSPNSDSVSKVGGSASSGPPPKGGVGPADGDELMFEFTASKNVTVVAFELLAKNGLGVDRIYRGAAELKIAGDGTYEDGKADVDTPGYGTNGTSEYPLNETAKIKGPEDKSANVNIGDFPDDVKSVEFTSEENANFVVTFVFADGSEKQFYFEITLA